MSTPIGSFSDWLRSQGYSATGDESDNSLVAYDQNGERVDPSALRETYTQAKTEGENQQYFQPTASGWYRTGHTDQSTPYVGMGMVGEGERRYDPQEGQWLISPQAHERAAQSARQHNANPGGIWSLADNLPMIMGTTAAGALMAPGITSALSGMGITNPLAQQAISGALKSAMTGGNPLTGAMTAGVNSGLRGAFSGLNLADGGATMNDASPSYAGTVDDAPPAYAGTLDDTGAGTMSGYSNFRGEDLLDYGLDELNYVGPNGTPGHWDGSLATSGAGGGSNYDYDQEFGWGDSGGSDSQATYFPSSARSAFGDPTDVGYPGDVNVDYGSLPTGSDGSGSYTYNSPDAGGNPFQQAIRWLTGAGAAGAAGGGSGGASGGSGNGGLLNWLTGGSSGGAFGGIPPWALLGLGAGLLENPDRTTTQRTEYPSWYGDAQRAALGQADKVAQAGADLTAPLSSNEQAGTDLARSSAGGWQPYINSADTQLGGASADLNEAGAFARMAPDYFARGAARADEAQPYFGEAATTARGVSPLVDQGAGMARSGARSVSELDLNNYMNPYVDAVLDPIRRRAEIQKAGTLQNLDAQAGMRGAFGGSRAAIERNLAAESADRNMNEVEANVRTNAFNQALSTGTADLARQLAAAGTTGGLANTLNANAGTFGNLGTGTANTGTVLNAAGTGTTGVGNAFTNVGNVRGANASRTGTLGTAFGSLTGQDVGKLMDTGGTGRSVEQSRRNAPLTSIAAYGAAMPQRPSQTTTSVGPAGSRLGMGANAIGALAGANRAGLFRP